MKEIMREWKSKIFLQKCGLVFFLIFFVSGCDSDFGLCDTEVLKDLGSENDGVVLSVSRKNCGATTSYAYSIHMSDKSKDELSDDNLIFRADKVDNLQVQWVDSTNILISVDSARVQQFRNYFWKNLSSAGYDEIKIKFVEAN